MNSGAQINIFFIIRVEILVLIKWSSYPPHTLTIASRMVVIVFWNHNPISLKHMCLWYVFLKARLTTYYSNKGVQLITISNEIRTSSHTNQEPWSWNREALESHPKTVPLTRSARICDRPISRRCTRRRFWQTTRRYLYIFFPCENPCRLFNPHAFTF